tara:strand:+ start:630 stop:992 length:363 start_codon:yes stop_codon:yes gene_type:complete
MHKGGTSCPICKKAIYEIKLDKEFDKINNNNIDSPIILNFTKNINIQFGNIPPGITICNNKLGILVKKLNKKEQCYISGIKVNDIITSLNGVPCREHSFAINIIKDAYINKKNLLFDIII